MSNRATVTSKNGISAEISGWNWGAFLLSWIWGIGNRVWLSLLCFIPLFNIVWIFVLAAKGNKWAWQNNSWESVEHFKRTQRKWGFAGLIVLIVVIVLYILAAVLTPHPAH